MVSLRSADSIDFIFSDKREDDECNVGNFRRFLFGMSPERKKERKKERKETSTYKC